MKLFKGFALLIIGLNLLLPVRMHAGPEYHKPVSVRLNMNYETLAYPNPFSEGTTIFYTPVNNETITVKLYRSSGQLLGELFDDAVEKGEMYRFELNGEDLLPGVYYYTIESGNNILHQRIERTR